MTGWLAVAAMVLSSITVAVLVIWICSKWTERRQKKNIAEVRQWVRYAQFCDAGIHRSALAVILDGQDLAILNGITRGKGITKEHITLSQLLRAGISQSGCRAISHQFDLGDEANEAWLRHAARRDNYERLLQ